MRTLKLFTILLVGLSFLFLPSCQQENVVEPQQEEASSIQELPYQQEITVTDSLEKNKIVLRFSSRNPLTEELLATYSFGIQPLFEMPSDTSKEAPEAGKTITARPDLESSIRIEIISKELEEGAIGLILNNEPHKKEVAKTNQIYDFDFIAHNDYIYVENKYYSSNFLSVAFGTKLVPYGNWVPIASHNLPPNIYQWYYKPYSYMMRAYLSYPSGVYWRIYVAL